MTFQKDELIWYWLLYVTGQVQVEGSPVKVQLLDTAGQVRNVLGHPHYLISTGSFFFLASERSVFVCSTIYFSNVIKDKNQIWYQSKESKSCLLLTCPFIIFRNIGQLFDTISPLFEKLSPYLQMRKCLSLCVDLVCNYFEKVSHCNGQQNPLRNGKKNKKQWLKWVSLGHGFSSESICFAELDPHCS